MVWKVQDLAVTLIDLVAHISESFQNSSLMVKLIILWEWADGSYRILVA